jgi:hypothetical protein
VRVLLFSLLSVGISLAVAQTTDLPLGHEAYQIFDRWESTERIHRFSTFKPFGRDYIRQYDKELVSDKVQLFNWDMIALDTKEHLDDSNAFVQKPLWKFYSRKGDFFSVMNHHFDLHVNPVWQLNVGGNTGFNQPLFTNSRGVELRGQIDKKVSFYSFFTENQIEYPLYIKNVADSAGLIPFEGFWKEYNETTTDFFRAMGHVNFNFTRQVNFQFGYGRHFIGNGQRSLLLSDFGNSYPYARLTTQVWNVKFVNLYAQLIADVFTFPQGTLGASRYPKKFMTAHYLDWAVTPNLNIGFFESIILGRPDSLGGSQWKLEYLNPIIFYRAVEQQDGSADNIILGSDLRWTPIPRLTLYGQFVLDEMIVSELLSGDQWWGNKYGIQAGFKVYDLMLKNSSIQVEYNRVRPYTYAHENLFTSYTHYLQPLAHPLGANFSELLASFQFQPVERIKITLTALTSNYGLTRDSLSVGRNINQSYNNRRSEYGNAQNQGVLVDLFLVDLYTSYRLRPNLFVDTRLIFRQENPEDGINVNEDLVFQAGFRWNIQPINYWF